MTPFFENNIQNQCIAHHDLDSCTINMNTCPQGVDNNCMQPAVISAINEVSDLQPYNYNNGIPQCPGEYQYENNTHNQCIMHREIDSCTINMNTCPKGSDNTCCQTPVLSGINLTDAIQPYCYLTGVPIMPEPDNRCQRNKKRKQNKI